MDEAKRATSSLASDANERVKSLLDQQVTAGADLMSNVAESVRVAADNLEPRIPQLANVARDASERIEAFSRDVRQQSASELAQAVAEFARRRPAVVFGVAAALGFVGFRLLNASPGISDHRNRSATDWRPEPRLGDSAYPVASPMNAGSARYSPATSTTAPGVHSQGVGGYPAGSSTNPQGSMSNPTGTPSKVSTENAPPISPALGNSMAREALQDTALPRVVAELFADLSDFVQKEFRLARAEVLHKLSVQLNTGIWLIGAGFLAILAVVLIIEGIVFAIASAGLALHWSCLVVAAVLAVGAAVMFSYARSRLTAEDLAPTRTARQLSEAMTAAKEHLR
jgi:ElaB/YqjD/DUF883 family membrane-anchored ribosome-binding protein